MRTSLCLVFLLLSCSEHPPPESIIVSSDETVLLEKDFEIYLTRVTMDEWKAEIRIFCPAQVLETEDTAYDCLAREARLVADIIDPSKENNK